MDSVRLVNINGVWSFAAAPVVVKPVVKPVAPPSAPPAPVVDEEMANAVMEYAVTVDGVKDETHPLVVTLMALGMAAGKEALMSLIATLKADSGETPAEKPAEKPAPPAEKKAAPFAKSG